jgi:hypothetical protein
MQFLYKNVIKEFSSLKTFYEGYTVYFILFDHYMIWFAWGLNQIKRDSVVRFLACGFFRQSIIPRSQNNTLTNFQLIFEFADIFDC